MKKGRKIICIFVISLLSVMGITLYFNYFQGFIFFKNDRIQYSKMDTENFTSYYTPKIKFENIYEKAVYDVHINILGISLPNDITILEKSQRYYLPVESISRILNIPTKSDNETIEFKNNSQSIKISNNNCSINDKYLNLRGGIIQYKGSIYISISDIEYILNLTAYFDTDSKTINLLNPLSLPEEIKEQPSEGRIALIRLEDFSAGASQLTSNTQIKYKIMADYLYTQGIKYHIAWVPRYKCPAENVDNNLLENSSFENAGFINTLDYFINHGGEIGLHGYTHQTEDSTSLVGTELSNSINSSEISTRNIIENAIDTAVALNIPYSFFESPHYKASQNQKNIIEDYFKYIYEPRNIILYNKIHKRNSTLYIPTPLNYVKNLDASSITKKLTNPTPGQLASLFYHPYLELDFIDYSISSNTINVNYNENSPLKQIINSIQSNNYVTCHLSDFK